MTTSTVSSLWFWRAGAIHAEHGSIWQGERGPAFDVPITWAMLDTDSGVWLVDCGMPKVVSSDPVSWIGEAGRRLRLTGDETLPDRFADAGIDASAIAGVILTHLHYDHAGGLLDLPPNIPVVVHERELATARAMDRRRGYQPDITAASAHWTTFSGDYSPLAGVELIETPGHTPGHCSVIVTLGRRTYLIGGDAAPTRRNIADAILPGLHVDRTAAGDSLQRLISVAGGGAELLPSHEAQFWDGPSDRLRRFTAAY